jgi:hypothetical protein
VRIDIDALQTPEAKVAFIEETLVHGPGAYEGAPFGLVEWQREFLLRLWAGVTGRRVIDRACLLVPKGAGKTELAAAIAVTELVVRRSALVVVAASSWDQVRTLFESVIGVCSAPSPMARLVDVTEGEIRLRNTTSKILRVASDGPRNDGLRPTCLVRDEVHTWDTPTREANYQVLEAGLAKRGGLALDTPPSAATETRSSAEWPTTGNKSPPATSTTKGSCTSTTAAKDDSTASTSPPTATSPKPSAARTRAPRVSVRSSTSTGSCGSTAHSKPATPNVSI